MTKLSTPADSYNQGGFASVDPAGFIDSYRPSSIAGDFRDKHIVTVDQFARADLESLFAAATTLKKRLASGDRGVVEIATSRVLALLFFESSTRTDMSFGMEQAQEACDSIKYCSVWLIGYQPCQPQPSCEDRMLSTAQAITESGGRVLGGIVSKDDASPANYGVLLDIEGFRQLVGQP